MALFKLVKSSILACVLLFPLVAWGASETEGPAEASFYASAQCVECHEDMAADHEASGAHAPVPCLSCHPGAAAEDHESPPPVSCGACHVPHDEKTLHDAHSRVTCKACHMEGGVPSVDPPSAKIVRNPQGRTQGSAPTGPYSPHAMVRVIPRADAQGPIAPGTNTQGTIAPRADTQDTIAPRADTQVRPYCARCHFRGNPVGASTVIPPPKSVLCMPCHAATFSAGDATTAVSLLVFLAGVAGLAILWKPWASAEPWPPTREASSRKGPRLPAVLLWDVLLLRRLYRLSPSRWLVHGLLFYPILARFAFGLAALLLSLYYPRGDLTQAMLDKNHPVTALFFDLTGVMILAGALAAILRSPKPGEGAAGALPQASPAMTGLLALVVLAGFWVEGLRMAMTGWPPGSEYALAGYAFSLMLGSDPTGFTEIYGYLWYAHAVATGAFVALVPFTRMRHIFTAPLVLILNAGEEPGSPPPESS